MTVRMRIVIMNERGQIVIPEEIRKDMHLNKREALVLIEKDDEIAIKKESAMISKLTSEEDDFWKTLSRESLKRAWTKEDEVWDRIAKEELK